MPGGGRGGGGEEKRDKHSTSLNMVKPNSEGCFSHGELKRELQNIIEKDK